MGAFLFDLAALFDIVAVGTLILYTVSMYQFLGLEFAVVLLIFSIMRGAGHFSVLRHYGVPCLRMRFLPVLGGFVDVEKFLGRVEEGFSALGASMWALASAVLSYDIYLLTGNMTCLLYTMLAFGINLIALVPIGVDLDGAAVIKSIAFSISRKIGLLLMSVNIFALPAVMYWFLSGNGTVDIIALSSAIIAGLQRFSEEYNCKEPPSPMSYAQCAILSGYYIVLILSFLFLPRVLGITGMSMAMRPDVICATKIGITGLLLLSVIESNIIFFINLKRRLFGN